MLSVITVLCVCVLTGKAPKGHEALYIMRQVQVYREVLTTTDNYIEALTIDKPNPQNKGENMIKS